MEFLRVQTVASNSKDVAIPDMFVRPETEQPGITTVHGVKLEVPIIDFNNPDEGKVLNEIMEASKKWGMFQIVNHEIPSHVIKKLQSVGKEFFELPQEEKELYAKDPESKSIEGYGTKLQKELNGKKGWVDHLFHIIWPLSSINYRFWPKNPPSYREANEEYLKYLHGVVDKLFKSMSIGLGFEENELKEAAGGDSMIHLLKINYYPPCPFPDLVVGVPPHTDMSYITILVPNDVQGLQAFRDGHWYDVKYVPNALVIHIGDQMEIMSNGKYKAVFHRTTVSKEETRISWPVFIEPQPEYEVGPHPKLVNEENPPKYKTKKYKDYAYWQRTCECARVFTIVNYCKETLWPAAIPGDNFNGGGFVLKPGQSSVFSAPIGWSGRIWARTGCNFDKNGIGNCQTGSCGTSLKCGSSGKTPASLAEFTLAQLDFYDVSLVDGFNVPISIKPLNGKGNCTNAGCDSDLRTTCPKELSVKTNGKTIGCRSACDVFNTDEYCCRGNFGNPSTCRPTFYSKKFKEACPTSYSYAYDDPTSICTCQGTDYVIAFCASRNKQVCAYHNHKLQCSGSQGLKSLFGRRWIVMLMGFSILSLGIAF